MLRVPDGKLTAARLGEGSGLEQGETVVALGFPAGATPEDARPRRAAWCRRRARRCASRRRTCPPTAARSRPTPRSTPASPAGRWPTATGAWSASTPRRARWAPTAARSRARTSRSASTARGRCWTGSARGESEKWTGATFGYPTTEELVDRKLPPGLYITGAIPETPAAGAGVAGRGEVLAGIDGPPRRDDAPVLLRRDGGQAERRDGDVHARAAGREAARGRSGAGVIAVVLAGGRSRRMGSPKAVVPLGGKPLIAWPLAAAAEAGLEAVVVAKPGSQLPPLDVPVWDEPEEPAHPLTGLVAALERAGGPIVALACDMPFVTPDLIARLAAARGIARPARRGVPRPLRARRAPRPARRARSARRRCGPCSPSWRSRRSRRTSAS